MNNKAEYTPEKVVDISNLSREDWLEYRKKGIGGSDVAAIMGISPFATIRDLFYNKTGVQPVIQEEEESNWVAKEVGHRLEDLVAEIFSKKTGLEVFPVRVMFRHPLYPFMLADVDFFVRMPDGTFAILECKTCNYNAKDKWADEGIPAHYVLQVRHYLSVMNMQKAFIACLYGNNENEFVYRTIERDLIEEEDIIDQETYFWQEHVLKNVVPPHNGNSDLVLANIRNYGGFADKSIPEIVLSGLESKNLEKYLTLSEEKSQLEKRKKEIEAEQRAISVPFVEQLGQGCKAVLEDGTNRYRITYNPTRRMPTYGEMPGQPEYAGQQMMNQFYQQAQAAGSTIYHGSGQMPGYGSAPAASTPPKTGQMLQGALQNLDTSLPVEELMKHMNYEMAVGTVIPGKGKYGGKTMGQVAVESPSTIQWFAEQYSGPNNLVPAAAKVILQKAMPMAG